MIEQCCPYATDACRGRNMPVCPYDGPVYGCRREELMLPMQDGVRRYTEIFKPEGLAQFPVLTQREQTYLLYRYGFTDGEEHPLIGTAIYFHLPKGRAQKTEEQAMDNLWLELPWWFD